MSSHAFSEKSIAAGFAAQTFGHLALPDRQKLVVLMARIAEQAYRRGAYQGVKLAGDDADLLPDDLYNWRYGSSLDQSPWLDDTTTEASTERLFTECGELEALGFTKPDRELKSDKTGI